MDRRLTGRSGRLQTSSSAPPLPNQRGTALTADDLRGGGASGRTAGTARATRLYQDGHPPRSTGCIAPGALASVLHCLGWLAA